MENQIRQICLKLNDAQITVTQATEKLLDLFNDNLKPKEDE